MLRTIWVAVHLLEKTCAQEAATGGGLEESAWVPRLQLARVQPVLNREFSEVEPSSKVMGAVGPLEKALTTFRPFLLPFAIQLSHSFSAWSFKGSVPQWRNRNV